MITFVIGLSVVDHFIWLLTPEVKQLSNICSNFVYIHLKEYVLLYLCTIWHITSNSCAVCTCSLVRWFTRVNIKLAFTGCCIYQKPRTVDESSTSESESDDDTNPYERMKKKKKHHKHSHDHAESNYRLQ